MLLFGLTVPFLGTVLGASIVFCTGKGKSPTLRERGKSEVIGVSAGLMTAAAFFSLLMPALAAPFGLWKSALGFAVGILLLSLVDRFMFSDKAVSGAESEEEQPNILFMMIAVVLHNIPEGMAVGTALASVSPGAEGAFAQVLAISAAIAIQNFPDGAIVSLPLYFVGIKKPVAFLYGVLSGAVEPLFALLTYFLAGRFTGLLPLFLAFAAGSMLYVVVRELIPEMKDGSSSGMGGFTLGFLLLMVLDFLLGG